MSVTCFSSRGEKLISFDYSQLDWNRLKLEYASLGLHMKCCGAPAIPKTSRLGTQFFAHKSNACGEAAESPEHMLCKELVVKGARQAGWEAQPEECGSDHEGNQWAADVLCSQGHRKIAFEVQLASQPFAEYKRRTSRYQNSGVSCFWLVRRTKTLPLAEPMILDRIGSTLRKDVLGQHPDRQDLPVFYVDVSNLENVFVFFPWHHGKGPFQITLDAFVCGVLSSKMSFMDSRWCWNA